MYIDGVEVGSAVEWPAGGPISMSCFSMESTPVRSPAEVRDVILEAGWGPAFTGRATRFGRAVDRGVVAILGFLYRVDPWFPLTWRFVLTSFLTIQLQAAPEDVKKALLDSHVVPGWRGLLHRLLPRRWRLAVAFARNRFQVPRPDAPPAA